MRRARGRAFGIGIAVLAAIVGLLGVAYFGGCHRVSVGPAPRIEGEPDPNWRLVAEARNGAPPSDTQWGECPDAERLALRLARLSPEEIVAFDRWFDARMDDAYSWDLQGACYVINGGCSDDGFHYYRTWLIAQGRAAYEAALRDPDAMAEWTPENVECQAVMYAASDAYEARTGREIPPNTSLRRLERSGEPLGVNPSRSSLVRRYPRLCRRFGC